MSEKTLHLADGLDVPRSIAARTVFVAGTKGSGKTHNAGVMAEEMLAAGVHVLILDPLGAWWGLRSDAKGGPGGYPVIILGGEHADAPLLPTSGEVVAEYVVRSGQSAILDMSGFASNAEQDRFVAALLAKLFRLKAAEKSALHLIIDEADMFAPERPMSATEIPLLGATKTIVTKGRSRGLSMTLITQRPQSIAKAAIEEADVVLCHRMQGVNAVKAMRAWTDLYATKEQAETFYASLPTLADGECWVWSPQFLKRFERHQFRRKTTFDSSRTPDPGETAWRPKAAAAVDLDKLTAEMRATAEAARANDPAELRRQLAAARAELVKAPVVAPARVEVKTIEKPVITDAQVAAIEKLYGKLESLLPKTSAVIDALAERQAAAQALRDQIAGAVQALQDAVHNGANRLRNAVVPAAAAVAPRTPTRAARPLPARAPVTADGGDPVTPAMQKILNALAWWQTVGVTNVERGVLAVIAGYTVNGHFNNLLGALRTAGLIDYPSGGTVGFTEAGRGRAAFPDAPATLAALHNAWMQKLTPSQWKIVEQVMAAHPGTLTKEQLAERAGYTVNGHFNNMLGSLRSLGVITKRGDIGATELLYPPALA